MLFEPESLPSASLSGTAPQQWAGDLLVLAVTEDDFQKDESEPAREVERGACMHACIVSPQRMMMMMIHFKPCVRKPYVVIFF